MEIDLPSPHISSSDYIDEDQELINELDDINKNNLIISNKPMMRVEVQEEEEKKIEHGDLSEELTPAQKRILKIQKEKENEASHYELSIDALLEIEEGAYILNNNEEKKIEEENEVIEDEEYQKEIPDAFLNELTETNLTRYVLPRLMNGGYYGRNNIFLKDGKSDRNDDMEPWLQPFFKERGMIYGYSKDNGFRQVVPPLPQVSNVFESHQSWGEIQELVKFYYSQQFPHDNKCPVMYDFNANYDKRAFSEKLTLKKNEYDTWLNAFAMGLFCYERSPYYLIQLNGEDLSSRKKLNNGQFSSLSGIKTRHWVIIQPFRYKTSINTNEHRLRIDPSIQSNEMPRLNTEKIKNIRDITYAGIYGTLFILILDKFPEKYNEEDKNDEEIKKEKRNINTFINRSNSFVFKQCKYEQEELDVMNLVSNIKPYEDMGILEIDKFPKNANMIIYNSSLLLKNTYPFCSRELTVKIEEETVRYRNFDFPAMYALFLNRGDENGHLMNQGYNLMSRELFELTTRYRKQYFNKPGDKSLENYYADMKKKFVLTHGPTFVDPVALFLGISSSKGSSINQLRAELNPIKKPIDIVGFAKCINERVNDLSIHFLKPLIDYIGRMAEDDNIDDRKVILYLSGPGGVGKTALYRVFDQMEIPIVKKTANKQSGNSGFYFEFTPDIKIVYIDEVTPDKFSSVMDLILNITNETGVKFEQKHKPSIHVEKKMGLIVASNYCLDCMVKNVDPEALIPIKQRIVNLQLGKHDCIVKKWTRPFDIRNKFIKYYVGDDKKDYTPGETRKLILGHIKERKEITELIQLKDTIFYLEVTYGVDTLNTLFNYKLYTQSYIDTPDIETKPISNDFIAVGPIAGNDRGIKIDVDIQDRYVRFQGIEITLLRNQYGVLRIELSERLEFIQKICTEHVPHPDSYLTSKIIVKIMELFHPGPCMKCLERTINDDYFAYPNLGENNHSVWCYACFRSIYYDATSKEWKMPIFDVIRTDFRFPR